ncbi:hypothetical protein AB0C70_44030 [Streptomyces sp. NPDC048564]|uniref:hypothetical protein n=1 Tax=Streptomyces sp. NPDC048564 TaxID=3155760 RepID=UPI0034197DF1
MTHTPERESLRETPPWAVVLCSVGLVIGIVLSVWYWTDPPFLEKPDPDAEMRLQFADGKTATAIVAEQVRLFQNGLVLDWAMFAPGYTLALAAVFGLGRLFLYRGSSRRWATRALAATSVPFVADMLENVFLFRALNRLGTKAAERELELASYCALIKWALVVPLVLAAAWLASTLLLRMVLPPATIKGAGGHCGVPFLDHAHRMAAKLGDRPTDPDVIAPPTAPHDSVPLGNWGADPAKFPDPRQSERARWRTRAVQPPGREPAELGICVSGGGIRSASVTLGALQALREKGKLAKARYLVSVSGGGYTAGAFQLALTPQRPVDREGIPVPVCTDLATAQDIFAPGSPEEDHIRRHAKYLADGPMEKVRAVGAVLAGLTVSLGMVALLFAVAGLCVHVFYSKLPLVDLSAFRTAVVNGKEEDFPSFEPYRHALAPILTLFALAALAAVLSGMARALSSRSRPAWVRSTVKALVGMALLVAGCTVVVPAVVWFFAWLGNAAQGVLPTESAGAGVSVLGAITAAATALGAFFTATKGKVAEYRQSGEKLGLFAKKEGGTGTLLAESPGGWLKVAICWFVLSLVAFFGLALMSWAAVYAGGWQRVWQIGLPLVLLVLVFAIDQTAFSLHPFYRQRLASAFAVRRAVLKDGSVGALPYDYNAEPTLLSTHARKVDGFPQVIFAASAAVSLRNRTAPGRPAVPFTFASDYVGGPDTGWVRTSTLQETTRPLVRRDLTVQSAMAVSGAAFASAMGTQTLYFERLLALSNARLGTWIPNPLYLAELARYKPNRIMPRLPRVRRLRYQLQELVGRYSDTSPMLLCTDGGHFDNLGLVELLRLRCRTIYLIDASGDKPPLATTLAQAVTLAYEELGVRITFGEQDQKLLDLVPGSAEPLEPTEPMAALNARFSAACAVRGTIRYPDSIRFSKDAPPTRRGTIIVAKANLTPDMPYELLSFALQEKAFPRRATFDQWFDHTQFDAYRALGHHLGLRAVEKDAGSRAPFDG